MGTRPGRGHDGGWKRGPGNPVEGLVPGYQLYFQYGRIIPGVLGNLYGEVRWFRADRIDSPATAVNRVNGQMSSERAVRRRLLGCFPGVHSITRVRVRHHRRRHRDRDGNVRFSGARQRRSGAPDRFGVYGGHRSGCGRRVSNVTSWDAGYYEGRRGMIKRVGFS